MCPGCVCVSGGQALNPDNEYHFKNRLKSCQRNWAEVFGDEANIFAVSPSNTYQKVRNTLLFRSDLLLRAFSPEQLPDISIL